MPPKKAKGGTSKQKPKEEQREETLQAVILADTFERRFVPLTNEKPRCLLPLANTPLIEYTLEFVAHAGVRDVYVYCGRHADQVEDYLQGSKWMSKTSPFANIDVLRSNATSVGDAMRDLDHKDLIKGDFLLVSGDVVSNLAIAPALAAHKARRDKDPNSIMTMILREAGPGQHRTTTQSQRCVFVIDPSAHRCLHYEEIPARRRKRQPSRRGSTNIGRSRSPRRLEDESTSNSRINIDPELLDHDELDIRTDLIDPHIDICTPDVLSLWSDNFDYQSLRTSFLYGVLKDYELNGKKLHTHIVTNGYAARVRSIRTYDAVSRDILEGWTFPMRPDSNLLGQSYRLWNCKVYTERGVVLARSSRIVKRSAVGKDTSVGEGSEVITSVIGQRCIIGRNVRISGSYVWDDTLIEDGAVLDNAIVANEAVIGKNVKLEPGSIVSYRVRVADDTTVSGTSRLVLRESGDTTKTVPDELEYASDSSDGSVASASSMRIYKNSNLSSASITSLESISTIHSEAESDTFSIIADDHTPIDRRLSMASSSSDPLAHAARHDFVKEVCGSVLEAISQNQSPDVVHLEVMNLRLTADASDSAVREAIVSAFVQRIFQMYENESVPAGEAASKVFKKYGTKILRQMGIRTGSTTDDMERDEGEALQAVEKECQGRSESDKILAFAVTAALNTNVISQEGAVRWWEETGGEAKGGRKEVARLIEYLQEESEEEDEENEDDDDDDEEDEEESDD